MLLVLALAVSPAWAQPLQGSAPDPGGCRRLIAEQREAYARLKQVMPQKFFNLRAPGSRQAPGTAQACRECDAVAAQLSGWAGSPVAPVASVHSTYPAGCVGHRQDLAGTRAGAECIAQFLGRGYYVSAPGRQCTQDGFPYTIVPLH